MLKWMFIGLWTALMILPGSVSGAEIYSVQVGIYQKIKNAENQCQALRRMIDPSHLEALRIEKKGPQYAVRIGQFDQEQPARELLSRIQKILPQAFLWKGEYNKAQIGPALRTSTAWGEKGIPFNLQPIPVRRVPSGSGEPRPKTPAPKTRP